MNEFKVKKGLIVTGSGSTIFDVQGSQGQLFSVTDSLTGVLFSVNDISGIPIFTVSSDDSLTMGTYGAEAIKINGSNTIINNLTITGNAVTINGSSVVLNNGGTYNISAGYATNAGNAANASTWGGYYLPTRDNWSTYSSQVITVGQLAWRNYGNNHTIFDASSSDDPNGNVSVNNANPNNYWTTGYPTLMGWDGADSFGVRVDTARYAENSGDAAGLGGQPSGYYINTSNINSQSVFYANYAGDATSLGGLPSSYYINTSNIGSQSVAYASSSDVWGGYFLPTRTNWNTYSSQNIVVGQLGWRANGDNYTIFDASAGLSPDNSSINNTYVDYSWASSYPTLMGWDGSNTYGVRVDRAQAADYADNAGSVYQASALYDPYSGGYILGNYASYGSFIVTGTRNGYAGFEFEGLNNGNVAIMMNQSSNESGFYNTSYGWQTMWSAGTLYVFKNNYGGGTQATVLDSSNYNSYAVDGSGTSLYLPRFNGTKSLTNSQIYDNGTNVGVNTTSMSGKFHVNGVVGTISIFASGDIVAYSDQSVKNNIRPIDNVLERVVNSRGVIYDRTDIEANDNIGFIAQELEVQFPELVSTSEDGTKAVKYQNATAVLFEAVKEQQKQIDELNEKINNVLKLIEK